MHASEDVHMGSHHPQLEQVGALLPGDSTQERHEKPGKPYVDERSPVASGPYDVTVETMKHTEN